MNPTKKKSTKSTKSTQKSGSGNGSRKIWLVAIASILLIAVLFLLWAMLGNKADKTANTSEPEFSTDNRISALESKDSEQDNRISALESKDSEQDRLIQNKADHGEFCGCANCQKSEDPDISEDPDVSKDTDTSKEDSAHVHEYTIKKVTATCNTKGYTVHSCSCGSSYKDNDVAALGHNFVKGTVVDPTETSEGYTVYKCSRCGATEKRDVTSKVVLNPQPSTDKKTESTVGQQELEATAGTGTSEGTGNTRPKTETITPVDNGNQSLIPGEVSNETSAESAGLSSERPSTNTTP